MKTCMTSVSFRCDQLDLRALCFYAAVLLSLLSRSRACCQCLLGERRRLCCPECESPLGRERGPQESALPDGAIWKSSRYWTGESLQGVCTPTAALSSLTSGRSSAGQMMRRSALRVLPHVAALFSLRLRELMQHCELMHPSASSCCLRPSARRPRPCVRANTS